jgi:hypothetical protein
MPRPTAGASAPAHVETSIPAVCFKTAGIEVSNCLRS